MEFHELANIFPLMSDSELSDLADDIDANGLQVPIVTYQGKILDGRNRWRACEQLGVEPRTSIYSGPDPLGYVVSLNLKRRQLTSSQLGFVGLAIEEHESKLAKERQRLSPGRGQKGPELIPDLKGDARDKAAAAVGTNPRYISDAKKLTREAPDLAEKVVSGETPITQANRVLKERKREAAREQNREKIAQAPAPEKLSGVYSTIVIDPPWDFADEGDVDQLGRGRPEYAQMSIEEICKLPIAELADDNAHIYMWITNRSLPKGFGLLASWGFRYITTLTWVKPSFGMGNYFRGQTEHVLFGVRGSLPIKRKDQGTVFQAPRGPNGHSSKPNEFYDIVESCSPGPYLEMFSRTDRPDWTVWGESSRAA